MATEDEEDEAFTEKFNKLFHKAMGEREKRFEAKLFKKLDEGLSAKIDELKELLSIEEPGEGEEKQKPTPGQQDPTGQQTGTQKLSPEIEAQIKQAQKDAKEAKDRAEKWEKEAKLEREKALRNEETTTLTQLLTGRVKAPLLDVVVKDIHGKNVVRDPESNKILWKNEEGEHLPLDKGIAEWSKTDYAREVAPPRDARGSGSRGSDGRTPGSGKGGEVTLEDFGEALSNSMGR